jgi:hypothetical protein
LRLQCEHQRLRALGALLQASAVVMVLSFMGVKEEKEEEDAGAVCCP